MTAKFEVSFNSPQCGWMSVGFSAGERSFHTTTAHAPHERALAELLEILSALLENDEDVEKTLEWNRDPEAYDLVFKRTGERTCLEIFEYPTEERQESDREMVFSFEGETQDVCRAFYYTFQQLSDERESDEFEQNWRQPFPLVAYRKFEDRMKASG